MDPDRPIADSTDFHSLVVVLCDEELCAAIKFEKRISDKAMPELRNRDISISKIWL